MTKGKKLELPDDLYANDIEEELSLTQPLSDDEVIEEDTNLKKTKSLSTEDYINPQEDLSKEKKDEDGENKISPDPELHKTFSAPANIVPIKYDIKRGQTI